MDKNKLSAWGISKAIYDVVENGFSYDEETGEVFFTSEDLDSLQESLDEKISSICGVIKEKQEEAEALKKRSEEVLKISKKYQNESDRLKSYLNSLAQLNNIKSSTKFGDYILSFRKSESVSIDDENALLSFLESNDDYSSAVTTKTTTSISKTEVKKILNSGVDVPGVSVITNNNIIIK